MATKVIIRNTHEVIAEIKKSFSLVRKNPKLLKQMAATHVKRIQGEARRGKAMRGLKRPDAKLPDLTEFSVMAKKVLAISNTTHGVFRPNRKSSNLTITGKLIDNVKSKVKAANGRYLISIAGSHVKYRIPTIRQVAKTFSKKDVGHAIAVRNILAENKNSQKTSNRAIYKALIKLDPKYQILNINDKLKKTLNNQVLRFLRRSLRARGF